MNKIRSLMKAALLRREDLLRVTNAVRLVNGRGDGLDGLLIDRWGAYTVVQIYNGRWRNYLPQIREALTAHHPARYLIVKTRRGLDVKNEILAGGNSKAMIEEHGLKFNIDLNDGLNCGLFLDMRHNRKVIGQICRGKKVLNCFAYTCSFGVYARAHGAADVVNVDISRKALDKGRANYALNRLTTGKREFVRADSAGFLTRALKKCNRFDVVILDPPSFARYEGKIFQVKRDLPKLIALSVAGLNPEGVLFVSTNCSTLTHADLEGMLANSLNGRKVQSLRRLGQDVDFVGSNSFKESYLVGVLARLE